ncbi:UPF0518 protein [Neolecta irregularis DAH-3]|uniref:UPF0518 protein n=1 Tax=Neolecta irregularis (strain DAH-3) TaxID=1198029 RepID=A0A1U7LJM9_NEOID|nr:UPF0518 protein [Neolecta irregularis DAH-3]|eukprot:OLL22849.1 UPF0518 protein [Neolecta irregularis DAH-3]
MEFLRKIAGPRKNQRPKATPYTKDQRFNKFKETFENLLELWQSSDFSHIAFKIPIIGHVQLLTDLLIDEERIASTTGPLVVNSQLVNNPCMHFAIRQSVFPNLAQIAQQSSNDICREILKCFAIITEMDDDELLNDPSVIASFKGLLRFVASSSDRQLLQQDLARLLFSIANKFKIKKRILHTWFDEETLVYRTVCADGEVGSFARTGLLLLIEAAITWEPLELWLANDSDMGILMSCGLGALYSQLSSKLTIDYSNRNQTAELLTPERAKKEPRDSEIKSSESPDFLLHLGEFLTYLAFWQDILSNCQSEIIRKSLLIRFEQFFLAQVLYPSLVDSLDLEAPSAVAVLTYVRALLENLQHPEIVEVIINYLFGEQLGPSSTTTHKSHARRATNDLLSMIENGEDLNDFENMAPSLFSLADVIIANLDSKSPQSVAATLKLVSTLLRKNCSLVYSRLLRIVRIPDKMTHESATIGRHMKEMELLLALTDMSDQTSSQSYASYLRDSLLTLEIHPCHIEPDDFSDGKKRIEISKSLATYHSIKSDSPFLKGLLRLFSTFLENAVDVNLILTRILVDLASCKYRTLDGWLLFGTDASWLESGEDNGEFASDVNDTRLNDSLSDSGSSDYGIVSSPAVKRSRQTPVWRKLPPFLASFRALSARIQQYQGEIDELPKLLEERRRAFLEYENSEAPNLERQALSKRSSTLFKRMPTSYFVTAIRGFSSPMRKSSIDSSTPTPVQRTPHQGTTTPITQNSILSTENSPIDAHLTRTSQRIRVLRPTNLAIDMSLLNLALKRNPEDIFMASPTLSEISVSGSGDESAGKDITISHLLNNIVIFQEFIKELAAIIQTRRALYENVKLI